MKFGSFSYNYYCDLIGSLKQISPIKDFSAITASDESFFILRHDIEFSIERALALAQLEYEQLNIASSYFFQIRNNAYNVFSKHSLDMIHAIHDMGHAIGLHVHQRDHREPTSQTMTQLIRQDIQYFSQLTQINVDRFSFHRPTPTMLRANLNIDGLINAYGEKYFQYDPHHQEKEPHISYFSDSEHQWKYGHPLVITNRKHKKFQLLIHPYSWTSLGLDNYHNFKSLLEEKLKIMAHTINTECHHFPHELLNETL